MATNSQAAINEATTAAAAAIALATKTHATAEALASAKTAADIAAAVLGNDIKYIQKDIAEINTLLHSLSTEYVTKETMDTATGESNLIHVDHETRIRLLEKTATQIMTWGTVAMLAIGVIEFLIVHFVK